MLSIRQVVQDYGRSCEYLLSNHSFDSPPSEEGTVHSILHA